MFDSVMHSLVAVKLQASFSPRTGYRISTPVRRLLAPSPGAGIARARRGVADAPAAGLFAGGEHPARSPQRACP